MSDFGDLSEGSVRLLPGFHIETFNRLLIEISRADISDIRLESNQPIRLVRHGRQYRLTDRALSDVEITNILNGIYGTNAMAQLAQIQAIHKRHAIAPSSDEVYAFRFNAVRTRQTQGMASRISLRTIPRYLPTLDQMQDLDPKIVEAFMFQRGIGLFVGETGNGKSTLAAALNRHMILNGDSRTLLCWEKPIEFDLTPLNDVAPTSNVSQHEIGESVKTFYDGCVDCYRSLPTDIFVGEAKDRETIDAVIGLGESGHKTNSTVHAGSVPGTIFRIANEFAPDQQTGVVFKLVMQLNFIVVQKLVESSAGGRRYPVREWLVLDDSIRKELLALSEPRDVVRTLGVIVRDLGQDFRAQALKARSAGLISENGLRSIVLGG